MLLIVGFACGIGPDLFPVFRKQVAYTAENNRVSGLAGKNQIILAGSGLFVKPAGYVSQRLCCPGRVGNLVEASKTLDAGLNGWNTVCRNFVRGSIRGLQCGCVGGTGSSRRVCREHILLKQFHESVSAL